MLDELLFCLERKNNLQVQSNLQDLRMVVTKFIVNNNKLNVAVSQIDDSADE